MTSRVLPRRGVECLDCHFTCSYEHSLLKCPHCNSQWLEARYNYSDLSKKLPEIVINRAFNLWRYRELLPVHEYNPGLNMGEGGTPLIHAKNLGMMLGCPHLYIKDERQGPTASFKDRQAAVNIAALKEAGITEAVLASTGNVAISYSAYAARAGIKLWAFLTSLVPAEKMREVAIYGTQVIKVTGTYDQTKKIAAEYANKRNLYFERGARSIPSVAAMKTIAYEIAEQLTWFQGAERKCDSIWTAPDWYFQSISGGLGPLGVLKGFRELHQMGLINRVPALGGIQAEGCSPMVSAWKQHKDVADPVDIPRTHIATLATGDPGRTYTLLCHSMQENGGGLFESADDEETYRTIHILAKLEGISVEPAAAVAFAGLIKLVRAGAINPSDVIVVNCTGHTMPIESTILGEGWAKDVIISSKKQAEVPQEGLLAALDQVSSDRFPNILIVDDTEEARRLIRRILQAQGNYHFFEASNGIQAIEMAQKEFPDLIILDLMMPGVDGFAVLDALKHNLVTSSIPVIVVTAKVLTNEEKQKLSGRIVSLMQKGEFMSDELFEEVRNLVK